MMNLHCRRRLFRNVRSLLACIAIAGATCQSQASCPDDSRGCLQGNVARRDFFALTAIAQSVEVRAALAADATLTDLQEKRDQNLAMAVTRCHDAACFDDAFRWTDEDIAAIAAALQHLAAENSMLQRFVETDLRGSGRFVLYNRQPAPALLASAWKDAAAAMNRILDVYGEGKPPFYPRIDSMRYDPKAPEFLEALQASAAMIRAEEASQPRPFFFAAMKYSVLMLATNERLDAGRFEPLEDTENRAAVRRINATDWKRYPYSVIVVPGEGPEQPDVELSPLGRIRVELAVRLYREGKAPIILVSGGTVHPAQTKFNEAMEMRKELEQQWAIPEDAILVDPYARHTTTNLRNAAREVLRYGMPHGKPMLISSDSLQVSMIVSTAFENRCIREMHLLPWMSLKQLGPTQAVMLPNRDSLQENAEDPLDP
jgi:hypothetical protein